MSLREAKYSRNVTTVKLYGCNGNYKIKVVTLATKRNAGVEDPADKKRSARCTANDEKLANNVARARSAVYELGLCNPWDYFFTGTLSSEKFGDRHDLKKFQKKFAQWIRDQRKKYSVEISYLLVFEKHKDGAWHVHGLLAGLPESELHQFQIGDRMSKYIADKVRKGSAVYNWLGYAEKFGFCDLEPVIGQEACVKYILKYITKDLASSVSELNAHLYLRSQKLQKAQKAIEGFMVEPLEEDENDKNHFFKNDYVKIWTYEYSDILLNEILERFAKPEKVMMEYVHQLTKGEVYLKKAQEKSKEIEALFEADGWELIPC